MPKVSLIKLLDEVLLPIILVIAAKLGGIFLISYWISAPWQISLNQSNLNQIYFISFHSSRDLTLVSSFSDLFAVAVCGIGVTWIIFRSHFLNLDTVHPKISAHLHRVGREFLLSDSYHLYHQAAVWLSLAWITFAVIFSNTLLGITSSVVLGIATVVSLSFSIVLYRLIQSSYALKT